MTKTQFKQIATSKLESLTTNDLIVELKKLQGNYSESAALLESSILDILDLRMESKEFIELCNSLNDLEENENTFEEWESWKDYQQTDREAYNDYLQECHV